MWQKGQILHGLLYIFVYIVEPLIRGHPDDRPPPLKRPLDNINLNINVLILTRDHLSIVASYNYAMIYHYYRDIQDKYRMNLTSEAKKNMRKTSTNASLSHTIFIRTQYDVLRRIRSYWLPRYIVHKERIHQLRSDSLLLVVVVVVVVVI